VTADARGRRVHARNEDGPEVADDPEDSRGSGVSGRRRGGARAGFTRRGA